MREVLAAPRADDLRPKLRSREEFVRDVRAAVSAGRGFAAGKIGYSEQQILLQPILRREGLSPLQHRALSVLLRAHALGCSGIFPGTPEMFRDYARFFGGRIGELDYLGLFLDEVAPGVEGKLLSDYGWRCQRIFYRDQEPDRSLPDDPARCYLEAFRGKRLLLVCPFAGFLRARATREVFEAVWAETGKRWFEPQSVEAVEFPYGFLPATWAQYAKVYDLIDEIERKISASSAEVVLLAAGGIGIPLAVAAKRQGKVAIALGGHLQVLFGVLGRRWRESPEWQHKYINPHWVDLPERYWPSDPSAYCEGSYW